MLRQAKTIESAKALPKIKKNELGTNLQSPRCRWWKKNNSPHPRPDVGQVFVKIYDQIFEQGLRPSVSTGAKNTVLYILQGRKIQFGRFYWRFDDNNDDNNSELIIIIIVITSVIITIIITIILTIVIAIVNIVIIYYYCYYCCYC